MNRAEGMTLLEVLVALVVFSMAGIALMQSVIVQTNGLSTIEQKMFASWVAQNQMVNVMLSTNWPDLSGKSGKEEMAGQDFYWSWKGIETSDPSFRAIDVSVKDQEKAKDPRITLRSYMAK